MLSVKRSANTSHFATDSYLHEILVDSALWGDKSIICVVGVQVSTVLGYCRILSGLRAVADRLGSILTVRAEGRWKNVPVPTLLLTSAQLTDYVYLCLCELHEDFRAKCTKYVYDIANILPASIFSYTSNYPAPIPLKGNSNKRRMLFTLWTS